MPDLDKASVLNASTKSSSAPSVDRFAAAATPRPWCVTTCADYWIEPVGAADDGEFRGIAHCGDIDWPKYREKQYEWEANARLIVAAVNAYEQHQELIEALTHLTNEVFGVWEFFEPTLRSEIGNSNYAIIQGHQRHASALLKRIREGQ